MSPEALARLRSVAEFSREFNDPPSTQRHVNMHDLRALLDAYDEALERLSPFAHRECDDSVAGYVCGCEQCLAFRFLAKAGRR